MQECCSFVYTTFNDNMEFIPRLVDNVLNDYRGYDLWQRARLQLAEFDQQRGVHDIDVGGDGQLEQFSKDHLNSRNNI